MKKKVLKTLFWVFLLNFIILNVNLSTAHADFYNENDIRYIPVNSPTSLSYLSKQTIYNLRKRYVSNSIFANSSYEPSNEVFGQIVDNKPWMSVAYQFYDKPCITNGNSEESRFINNPSILVALSEGEATSEVNKTNELVWDPDVLLIPRQIQYNKNKKEITVTYHVPDYGNSYKVDNLTLSALNARDFGYRYGFVDKNQSSLDIEFINSNNITNSIVEFQDFIHLGYSCQVEGGCNNGSPYQPMLTFKYDLRESGSKAVMYIKLWKNKPSSPYNEPDIIEKIVLYK